MPASCLAVVAWLWSTGAAATSLTLDDALARARTAHPAVRAAAADVDAARARLAQAGVLPANPVVSVDLARHSEPGNTGIDRGVSLSQEVEVGGQGRSSTRRRR